MVTKEPVLYQADGVEMRGQLFLPEGDGRCPGVLLAHEANGLDQRQLERASALCELGYAVLAMDYHGGGRVYSDRDEMMARLGQLATDVDRMRAIGLAALEALLAEPRVDRDRTAAIGHCFGAVMVMELARSGADLKAVVGLHPGWADHDPATTRHVRGKVLMCIGAEDPLMPPELRRSLEDELRASGTDWQVHVHGGAAHSFSNPDASSFGMPGVAYDERTDRRTWRAMLGLFDEVFG